MKRLLLVAALLIPTQAMATDPACGGWLCMAVGFGHPSCQPAKREMFKRMLEGKSPLPGYSSCSVDGKNENNNDVQFGTAILMRTADADTGSRVRVGGFCNFRDSGPEEPLGCVATLRTMQIIGGNPQVPSSNLIIVNRQGNNQVWIRDNLTGQIMSPEAYAQLEAERVAAILETNNE